MMSEYERVQYSVRPLQVVAAVRDIDAGVVDGVGDCWRASSVSGVPDTCSIACASTRKVPSRALIRPVHRVLILV